MMPAVQQPAGWAMLLFLRVFRGGVGVQVLRECVYGEGERSEEVTVRPVL